MKVYDLIQRLVEFDPNYTIDFRLYMDSDPYNDRVLKVENLSRSRLVDEVHFDFIVKGGELDDHRTKD